MIRASEYFRSVEHIWVIWLISMIALAWLLRRALRGLSWKALLRREEGAAYSLSYVFTFPVFVLVVCLVIECSLILIVKMGTVYSAYAGARANIVWSSMDPGAAPTKTKQAAVHAMVGFASSSGNHAQAAGIGPGSSTDGQTYYQAYQKYAGAQAKAPLAYLMAKYRFAERATDVSVRRTSDRWDADVTVTVKYEMPLHVPGIARLLGHRAPWPGSNIYTYPIESHATLQDEAPQNDGKTLGIRYVSP